MSGQTTVVVSYTTSTLIVEDAELGTTAVIETQSAPVLQILDAGIQGPAGSAGAGSSPTRIDFTSSGTWTYNHNLGRVPIVLCFLSDGHRILSDLVVTDTYLSVTHAAPVAGFVLFL